MKPNQLSNTAAFIAIKFYGLTRDETFRGLFDKDVIRYYEQLVQSFPAPLSWYHTGLKRPALRHFFTFWEELLLPGDLMHIILRKWYLTRWVERLYGDGYQQMLVLGSGFDHLATLYSSRGMNAVAIDTPRMIQMKQHFINSCGYANPNLTLQEGFFSRDNLLKILAGTPALEPSQKTIIIAEGFFDYFKKEDCVNFLNDLQTFFTNETKLLSTIFSLPELPEFRAWVYKNSIWLAGEELKLDMTQPDFLQLLSEHEVEVEKSISYKEMREEVLLPRGVKQPVLPGFYLIEAKTEPKP